MVDDCRELQQVWNKDAFLRLGGTAKASKRQGEKFNELYAACHAAEDKLKDLTLKHGKAVKGVARSRAQQENVAPTEKRRDALRSAETQRAMLQCTLKILGNEETWLCSPKHLFAVHLC